VGEEGEYTLDESLTEGKRVYCSQTDKSPEVTTRLEREGGEERKRERRKKEPDDLLCPEERQPD
jgi:hypothetical protein